MDYKYKEENYNIWVERIKDIKDKDSSQICSRDIGLNELEGNQILSKIKDGSKILEIGCGNGFLLEVAINQGWKNVSGIEPSIAAINQAKPNIRKKIIIKSSILKFTLQFSIDGCDSQTRFSNLIF